MYQFKTEILQIIVLFAKFLKRKLSILANNIEQRFNRIDIIEHLKTARLGIHKCNPLFG